MAPTLIVCGPQTDLPSQDFLNKIRQELQSNTRLRKLLAAIEDLPRTWQTLIAFEPSLSLVPGLEVINAINHWLGHGLLPELPKKALNVLFTPLTVLFQLVEYMTFLERNNEGISHPSILGTTRSAGIQGFCTGYLTAAALSLSEDEDDIAIFGAIALRLALCIGAFVDLAGPYAHPAVETSCLTVRWRDPMDEHKVKNIITKHSGAYISVIPDKNSYTITTPKTGCSELIELLSSHGLIIKGLALEGLFHSKHNRATVQKLLDVFASNEDFQFPEASKLFLPLRSNIDADVIKTGSLEQIAAKTLVLEMSDWNSTISNAISALEKTKTPATLLTLGPMPSVSATTVRDASTELLIQNGTKFLLESRANAGLKMPRISSPSDYHYPEHAIAIVGMACRFPGAASVDEFWQVISSGTSMVGPVPPERFSTEKLRRSGNKKTNLWGNFVRDADAFDHKFFKKSSREAQSMDPQQRFLLEVTYDALLSSGHFGDWNKAGEDDTGCFLGIGATDYCDNVASHPPNAFSAVGTLRAFLSGRLSHYFGWTGPSITYDTACSSSAVAIHAACRELISGKCSRALAGGVNLITSPALHQNLAAANFLSPTGACKSFDARADGYCRGEGVGLVVLKRLADAMANSDNIHGVIAGSAVNQSNNASPITVPHSASQIDLYRKVASLARIDPLDVSFVEAHGTGTPVGDPIECESIRKAFARPERNSTMYLGSVKANIGHAESASGAAALIKTVLMLQHKTIPVQPNFTTLNPKIPKLDPDHMEIPRVTKIWDAPFRAACINNYGAAGSNAALIVCQAPVARVPDPKAVLQTYPIIVTAHTDDSLKRYCEALRTQISQNRISSTGDLLSSIAFNLATKQNRVLPRSLVTSAATVDELDAKLSTISQYQGLATTKPVVLAFSGQTGDYVGLSEDVYSRSALFSSHLDHCNDTLRALGLPDLFPGIFSKEPVLNITSLHCMLFSHQYASAMSWIDSGLRVDALVGHSFGQLTALCISGTLSLVDAIKLVSGRAALIELNWGKEKGSMLHIEGDEEAVGRVSVLVNDPVSVACYNAPTSHILTGSQAAISAVEKLLEESGLDFGVSRYKRLNTTHGFHSKFTEPLLPKIIALAEQLTFHKANIPLETCTEGQSWTEIGPLQISQHTRFPVYFSDAISRISDRLGPCTWIGVGPGSTIMNMVGRALDKSTSSLHSLQSVQLEGNDAMNSLAGATANLWKFGNLVQFWPFHKSQKSDYTSINLPPYQFEKSRHWLGYIDSIEVTAPAQAPATSNGKMLLLSPITSQGQLASDAEFLVNQRSEEFSMLASGHAVLGQPLCPVALYLELAVRAAMMTDAGRKVVGHDTSVEGLEIKAPLGLNKNRYIKLTLNKVPGAAYCWSFQLCSQSLTKESPKWTVHSTGRVVFSPPDLRSSTTEFGRFMRLIDHNQYSSLIADNNGEAMQGKVIYKLFDQIVKYADYYRGVKSISSKDNRVAGLVTLSGEDQPWLESSATKPIAIDNFLQVAGVHVNSLLPCASNEVYVATQVEAIQFGSSFNQKTASPQSWNVYSTCSREGNKEVVNDIFVFDPLTKKLVMMILGAHFIKALTPALTKILTSVNSDTASVPPVVSIAPAAPEARNIKEGPASRILERQSVDNPANPQVLEKALLQLLNKVADVPMHDSNNEASFEDLGIDSLMINEVLSEIYQTFSLDISLEDFQQLQDIKGLVDYIQDRQSITSEADTFSSKYPTPATVQSSATSSLSEDGFLVIQSASGSEISQLAQLLGEQLEILASDLKEDIILSEIGLDSLLTMEVAQDIEKKFGVQINTNELTPETTFGQLCKMAFRHVAVSTVIASPSMQKSASVPESLRSSNFVSTISTDQPVLVSSANGASQVIDLPSAVQIFNEKIRFGYDRKADMSKFRDFWTQVYPSQRRLVTAYTIEAFEVLGCSLASMTPGQQLPHIPVLAKHRSCLGQLFKVLEESFLIESRDGVFARSSTLADCVPSQIIFEEILRKFPQHASEHKLLQITGSKLGQCLSGAADPIQLIFRDKATKDLLTDVYTHAPMFEAGTFLLGDFLLEVFSLHHKGKVVRILELGGGTGGTTKYIVDYLVSLGINFTYNFTDLSSSLVAAAKKKFSHYKFFEYMVLDIEKAPPERLHGQYDVVLSTNCIHATKNLVNSLTNIRRMLKPTGFVSLVELTRNIPWFDLVFGLLEGWWIFNDGRKHALADVSIWDRDMKAAGFKNVAWSEGTPEAGTLRIVAGFQEASEPVKPISTPKKMLVETVTFKEVEGNTLKADIYYQVETEVNKQRRPVALMIHGGGHIMLSRKDIRQQQTRYLLDNGFLPISIDYRLCPEINLVDGPMTDVCDALSWVRNKLPLLRLKCPGLRADGEKVVVVGWSTGGLLAMTLAWTAAQQNVKPPEAILAFYCPTDYEDPCWKTPNFPEGVNPAILGDYDLLESIQEHTISSYNIPPPQQAVGGWISTVDPRSRIALHMNWKGQTLPVLLRGLPSKAQIGNDIVAAKKWHQLSQPENNIIAKISPYAQILKGAYRTPTFLIHGKRDDLIPWQQTERFHQALTRTGVASQATILEDAIHLFDLHIDKDSNHWRAIIEGYKFLFSFINVPA